MAKKYQIDESPYGICTDPNAIKAPKGALETAEHVTIGRDGIVGPRKGADPIDMSSSNLADVDRIIPWNGDELLIDLATPYTEWRSNLGALVSNEEAADITWPTEHVRAVEARGNLYLSTADGVTKIASEGDTTAYNTGVLPHIAFATLVASTSITAYNKWLANDKIVAYRVTVSREDSNGLIVESAPTGPGHVISAAAGPYYVSATVALGSTLVADEVVTLYRSYQFASSVDPGDSMFKVLEYTLTSSDISSGSVSLVDAVDDTELGAALYTNPGQQGIDQKNDPPHVAKELAVFNGSLFLGNITYPHRLSFLMNSYVGDLEGETVGQGARVMSATFTSGSPTVTIANASGVEIGQKIVSAAGYTDSTTYIANIVGTTVTMTKNATGSGVDGATAIHDVIYVGVDSDDYEVYNTGYFYNWSVGSAFFVLRNAAETASSEYLVTCIDAVTYSDTVLSRYANNMAIRRIDTDGDAFSIWATHGESFEPALNGPTSWDTDHFVLPTANLTSEQESRPDSLMWSKFEMPEHVPEANSIRVGDSSDILRLIPSKDVLFIFKKDGIYYLTGANANASWDDQLFSPTYRLLRPDAAVLAEDDIYAITNNGFIRIRKGEITEISKYFINEDIKSYTKTLDDYTGAAKGCWVTYSKENKEVFFGLPTASPYSAVSTVYVYNTVTEVFYTIPYDSDINYIVEYNSGLLYGGEHTGSSGEKLWTTNSISIYGGENRRNKTISNVNGNNITFASAHEAAVGDYIVNVAQTTVWEITAIIDSDELTVSDSTGLSALPVYIFTPVTSELIWLPKFGDTRALRKHFTNGTFIFETLDSLAEYEYTTDGGTNYNGPLTINYDTVRYTVPLASARGISIKPGIKVALPCSEWELAGMSIEFTYNKPRGV